jgi:hypothetical protein
MLRSVEAAVICVGGVLALVPFLLVVAYLFLGRQRRVDELKSYVRASAPAKEVLPPDQIDGVNEDESLANLLARRYWKSHSNGAYLTALVVFYVVYGVLLYWTLLAWGIHLGTSANSPQPAPQLWSVIRAGGAGVLGATLAVLWHLHWRVVRLDLQPRTLLHCCMRLCVAPFVAVALVAILPVSENGNTLVAFGAGLFSDEALRRLRWIWHRLVGTSEQQASLPLRLVQGIGSDDELRLWEEGITDAQHLAVETVVRLVTNTNYSLERIVDWKDQAYLYVYVGEEIVQWRAQHTRAALDVLGMAAEYYGAAQSTALVEALARKFGKDTAVIDRMINTIYQDPQVKQLWRYVVNSYPLAIAEHSTYGAAGGVPNTKPGTPAS